MLMARSRSVPRPTPRIAFPRKGEVIEGRYRYRIGEKLGRGGFGAVFRAAVESSGKGGNELPPEVAIKFTLAQTEEQRLLVAKRELSALQVLQSDRIPALHDWSLQPENVFLVTDFFPAGNLKSAMKANRTPTEAQVWRLLGDLLRALSLAHRRGILHLDIKPENVLLDGQGGFVLTDFGISQATLHNEGADHIAAAGTPGYQSPEQMMMDLDQLDTQSDLFSIGVTAWAYAAGIDLSNRKSLLRFDNAGSGVPPVERFRSDLSAELSTFLAELTAVDPEGRPGGAAEALTRIRAHGHSVGELWEPVPDQVADALRSGLVDPLWSSLANRTDLLDRLVLFEDGTVLTREGEEAFEAFLLLRGCVEVTHRGEPISMEKREGTMIGEIATLTGTHRTATAICRGPVYACVFNAADLERFLTRNPTVTLRLLKDFSERMVRERAR